MLAFCRLFLSKILCYSKVNRINNVFLPFVRRAFFRLSLAAYDLKCDAETIGLPLLGGVDD